MFANAEDQDAVIAHRFGPGFPALFAPALFGAQVKVVIFSQRREGAENLTRNMEHRFAIELAGRENLKWVVIQA